MKHKWSERTQQPASLSFISSCNASVATCRNLQQIVIRRSIPQQLLIASTIDNTLQFRHAYAILNVPYARKETNRDYDGRISNSRGSRTTAQDIRGFCDTTSATKEIAWIQDRGFVACGSERIAGVSGKEEEYSRQKLKAGRIRLLQKNVAQSLLEVVQTRSDDLSSCYRCIHYSCCHMATSSLAVPFCTRLRWILGGGREDTHMFTTIGISPKSVYPYTLNSSCPIFGGSEAM